MAYKCMRDCVQDLERQKNQLIRISESVDPHLEMAEIHRRVFEAGGPALYFENVQGSDFPAVSNLFGDPDRARFIFRKTIKAVKAVIQLKADPGAALRRPQDFLGVPFAGPKAMPLRVRSGPVLKHQTTIDRLPQIQCWPKDGGPFITLPIVYSEDVERPSVLKSNLGMYRVQMAGNRYRTNEQIGLHYQIHRGIGVHHASALAAGKSLPVSIFVGGPPAHTFAAVMPLPEGLPETAFAGALAGRSFRFARKQGHVISTDADFCIVGTIENETLPEGPFGDHLGYYSLKHEFPVLRVAAVYHRKDAIWPFTVVGRPPQEDTAFGKLIHEMTGPMVPVSIPGLREMHAVDAAGVHPLLLAIGSERYVPYGKRVPQEILTIANAILGFNQASLAKYLIIAAGEDDPELRLNDLPRFLSHVLERVDWTRDLHFQTRTTIDTLDYSGTGFNQGSKVVIAAAGAPVRKLKDRLSSKLRLPAGYKDPRIVLPGIVAVQAPPFKNAKAGEAQAQKFAAALKSGVSQWKGLPLILLVDDSEFVARKLNNFLWAVFTRSNPSHDIYGVDSFVDHKHWGCRGPLIIDARVKPHHAPPLLEDPKVTERVDRLFAPGGSLHGLI
ncbi:MAG: UbiD family decarboxylase [bacterium]|nr:UbiD family decarboxylase [bacterium]